MTWKEFLKPTKEKIILFVVLAIFLDITIWLQIMPGGTKWWFNPFFLIFFAITFSFCYLIVCVSNYLASKIISAYNKFARKK